MKNEKYTIQYLMFGQLIYYMFCECKGIIRLKDWERYCLGYFILNSPQKFETDIQPYIYN